MSSCADMPLRNSFQAISWQSWCWLCLVVVVCVSVQCPTTVAWNPIIPLTDRSTDLARSPHTAKYKYWWYIDWCLTCVRVLATFAPLPHSSACLAQCVCQQMNSTKETTERLWNEVSWICVWWWSDCVGHLSILVSRVVCVWDNRSLTRSTRSTQTSTEMSPVLHCV